MYDHRNKYRTPQLKEHQHLLDRQDLVQDHAVGNEILEPLFEAFRQFDRGQHVQNPKQNLMRRLDEPVRIGDRQIERIFQIPPKPIEEPRTKTFKGPFKHVPKPAEPVANPLRKTLVNRLEPVPNVEK